MSMKLATALKSVTGRWAGTNGMRMMATDAYGKSASTAQVEVIAGGCFATIRYGWAEGGVAQDGLLLLVDGEAPGDVVAHWADSWHQNKALMSLRGAIDIDGVIRVLGAYGSGWGWRITIDPRNGTALGLSMHNIIAATDFEKMRADPGVKDRLTIPDYQVVEARYERAA